MIKAFYKFAAVDIPFELTINESVAAVFGEMLEATKKCSKAFVWIPQPAAFPPTIVGLATNLGRGVLMHYLGRLSMTCARGAALSYRSRLEMASNGIALAPSRSQAWA